MLSSSSSLLPFMIFKRKMLLGLVMNNKLLTVEMNGRCDSQIDWLHRTMNHHSIVNFEENEKFVVFTKKCLLSLQPQHFIVKDLSGDLKIIGTKTEEGRIIKWDLFCRRHWTFWRWFDDRYREGWDTPDADTKNQLGGVDWRTKKTKNSVTPKNYFLRYLKWLLRSLMSFRTFSRQIGKRWKR